MFIFVHYLRKNTLVSDKYNRFFLEKNTYTAILYLRQIISMTYGLLLIT